MQNLSDTPTEEVRRRVAEARTASQRLAGEIADLSARLNALRKQQDDEIALADHGERVLSWRNLTGAEHGDITVALAQLATSVEGGTIAALHSDDGHAKVEILDTAGRRWRVTFDGDVAGYWLPDYSLVKDEQLPGATILGAFWDDTWLIEATLGNAGVHIRLHGDPITVEEVANSLSTTATQEAP